MKALIFGILGAAAALLYWGYAVTTHEGPLLAEWTNVSIYGVAAAGFIVGWVIGFAITMIRRDW